MYGAVIGFLVCRLEYPFPGYTLVGSSVLVDVVRKFLSPSLARLVDTPLHLFLIYLLGSGLLGALLGLLTGIVLKWTGRSADKRRRFFILSILFLAPLLFGYLVCAVLHFRMPVRILYTVVPVVLVLSLISAFLVSLLLSRFVPKGEGRGRGFFAVGIALLALAVLVVSVGRSSATRNRNLVDFSAIEGNGNKVLMLGVDGIGWNLIGPMLERGELPAIARLIENGSTGTLRSITPPMKSPVIWTSIAGSRHKKDHGVLDFVTRSPKTGFIMPINNRLRKTTAFWEILTSLNIPVDILSWYPSWPPDSTSGIFLTDRATLEGLPQRVFPEERSVFLDSLLHEFRPDIDNLRKRITPYVPSEDTGERDDPGAAAMRRRSIAITDQAYIRDKVTHAFAMMSLLEGQPDVMAIYFRGTDTVQHKFRKYHAALHQPTIASLFYEVEPWEKEALGGLIESYVRFVDECIGEILSEIDPSTTVILISDHSGSYRYGEQIKQRPNALLVQLGLARDGGEEERAESLIHGMQSTEGSTVMRFDANLKGREKSGVVTVSRFASLMREVRTVLTGLRTTEGTPLFKRVWEGDDAGTVRSRGDLFAELDTDLLNDTIVANGEEFPVSSCAWKFAKSGNHRIDGVIILSGGNIVTDGRIRGASIFDVMPTLFYLLGLPVALDWEGKVLTAPLADEFKEKNQLMRVTTYETGARFDLDKEEMIDGANEQVMEELKALGYIN